MLLLCRIRVLVGWQSLCFISNIVLSDQFLPAGIAHFFHNLCNGVHQLVDWRKQTLKRLLKLRRVSRCLGLVCACIMRTDAINNATPVLLSRFQCIKYSYHRILKRALKPPLSALPAICCIVCPSISASLVSVFMCTYIDVYTCTCIFFLRIISDLFIIPVVYLLPIWPCWCHLSVLSLNSVFLSVFYLHWRFVQKIWCCHPLLIFLYISLLEPTNAFASNHRKNRKTEF